MSSYDWQPIATAPKDGTFILAHWDAVKYPRGFVESTRYDIVKWNSAIDEWVDDDSGEFSEPTHWMPLPPAPEVRS